MRYGWLGKAPPLDLGVEVFAGGDGQTLLKDGGVAVVDNQSELRGPHGGRSASKEGSIPHISSEVGDHLEVVEGQG